jgi:predicted ATP-grasp superfamily ATP-dependent carboligase
MGELKPQAVVMNMYYTGLGIARSLGEHGVPVIGLSAQRGCYGNFTRYAKTVHCPDSRAHPEDLLQFLLRLGPQLGRRSVIFPTRDDDVVFLDRFRSELAPCFALAVPNRPALDACLDKWKTSLAAQRAGVPAPRCWLIENRQDLPRIMPEVSYPCVLKPVAAADWRKTGNWSLVGGRKAIPISSPEELVAEYAVIAAASERALLQELVPGNDDCLQVAACYMDCDSQFVAGFTARKLLQVPAGFGTGCIVQATGQPDLLEPAVRLLKEMRFNGIAEVEFKWDAERRQHRLIEVNPRAWDQHRLGRTCGTDLAWQAYREHAGLPIPRVDPRPSERKWIAEDVYLRTALGRFVKRDPQWRHMLRLARGKRTYAIGSLKDPLPALAWAVLHFIPGLLSAAAQVLRPSLRRGRTLLHQQGLEL